MSVAASASGCTSLTLIPSRGLFAINFTTALARPALELHGSAESKHLHAGRPIAIAGRVCQPRRFETHIEDSIEALLSGRLAHAQQCFATGSIVISLDYFKRVIAGLRGLIGGRIKTYEPLLERARREALLRMTESAREQGYDAIFNVRLETSRLANATRDGKGTAGVEMLAFGTAVKFASRLG